MSLDVAKHKWPVLSELVSNPNFQSWEKILKVNFEIVFSLQIMEAMALHLESSYEKLYRWSQGTLYLYA